MVEEQVKVEILIPNRHPLLPRHEREIGSEFQKEPLQFLQNGGFEIPLTIDIPQSEKVEQIRITEYELRRHLVGFAKLLQFLVNSGFWQPGNRRPFEEHASDA